MTGITLIVALLTEEVSPDQNDMFHCMFAGSNIKNR
jgi:hypothetical protein